MDRGGLMGVIALLLMGVIGFSLGTDNQTVPSCCGYYH